MPRYLFYGPICKWVLFVISNLLQLGVNELRYKYQSTEMKLGKLIDRHFFAALYPLEIEILIELSNFDFDFNS